MNRPPAPEAQPDDASAARRTDGERDALLTERDGAVGTLTLNRPEKRNAISYAMWLRIPGLLAELDADGAVRVVVVTGAGDQAFSAGADIGDFEETRSSPERAREYRRAVHAACDALANVSKPTIAVVRGVCLGGGLELALCADIRIASVGASFGLPAARRGIVIAHAHVDRLLRMAGPGETARLLLSGQAIPAARAAAVGLISAAVNPDQVADHARELANEVASLSPMSHRMHKEVLRDLLRFGAAEQVPPERLAALDDADASEDFLEGVRAFRERRAPRFTGR